MADSETHRAILALPLAQRVVRYRQLAEDALKVATATHEPILRHNFLATAAQWRALEDEARGQLLATQSDAAKGDGEDQAEV